MSLADVEEFVADHERLAECCPGIVLSLPSCVVLQKALIAGDLFRGRRASIKMLIEFVQVPIDSIGQMLCLLSKPRIVQHEQGLRRYGRFVALTDWKSGVWEIKQGEKVVEMAANDGKVDRAVQVALVDFSILP